jgi:hypothetical protein
MKIISSLLFASVLAQEAASDSVSELERGKKNKNKYTTEAPTEPPTTMYDDGNDGGDDGGDGGSNYAPGGGSSGYGDPHFHILGMNPAQPDICFDFNDEPDTDIVLIQDNNNGFKVVGNLFKPSPLERGIYFRNIRVTSPSNTELYVDSLGWNIHTNLRVNPSFTWGQETLTYADMAVGEFHQQNHGGHKMTVTIIGGVTFEIESATAHGNINFKLLDHTLLSNDVQGVIGRFLPTGAYKVVSEDDSNKGKFYYKDQAIDVTFKRHAHNKQCWTMQTVDAKNLIENTSK